MKIVVVGAGVGGLAAAVRLAAAGHDVTVLEQAEVVGGKLGTHAHDGYLFDTGPSLLTLPHVLEELFAATGAPLEEVLPIRRLDVACRYRFPDGTELDLPGALASYPVYRTYVDPDTGDVDGLDRQAVTEARLHSRLAAILLLEERGHDAFVVRFQQTTPPVMAKGVEDTACYRYFRLAALNEVVWRNAGWDFWVGFKLWGAIPLTLGFAMANIPMLMRHGLQAGDGAVAKELPPE